VKERAELSTGRSADQPGNGQVHKRGECKQAKQSNKNAVSGDHIRHNPSSGAKKSMKITKTTRNAVKSISI